MSKAFRNPLPGVPNIESPFFSEIFGSMDISDEQFVLAESLRDKGYAVLEFPDADLAKIADGIKESLAGHYDWKLWSESGFANGDGLRIQSAWEFDENVKRIATNAQILELLTLLYGRQAWPFQTLNFPVGTQQHFHTDSVHFSSVPERFMCGVWVALEDVDEESGPLVYYPGSHKWPVFTNEHLRDGSEQFGFEALWEELVRIHDLQPVRFLPKKGQALIWAANLLHGGDKQIDKRRTRWSQVTHYYFDNCAYYTPLLSDPFFGRIQFRNMTNILTGKVMNNMYAGANISPAFIESVVPRPTLPDSFDSKDYLAANPDVAAAGVEAVAHYMEFGWREGRRLRRAQQ